VWKLQADSAEDASNLAEAIFAACALRNLHLALVQLPQRWFHSRNESVHARKAETVTCLRSVLMKPEHEAWLDRIWQAYTDACNKILK
jgi:hypothetical protein